MADRCSESTVCGLNDGWQREFGSNKKKDFDTFNLINNFLKAWDNGDISDDQKEMIRSHITPWTRQYQAPACNDFLANQNECMVCMMRDSIADALRKQGRILSKLQKAKEEKR